MNLDLITLSVPLFFAGVLLEVALNTKHKRGFYVLGDSLGSLGTGVLDQIAITLTRTALFAAPYLWLYDHARLATFDEATPLVLIGGLLLADLGYYWAHRLSHEISFLWAGHVVHHSSEQYNLTTALRQNWYSSWFLYLFNMPLAVAGVSPKVAVIIIPFIQLYQFWIHTRMIPKLGWFEWAFNTPSHHRVHHGMNPEYVDHNYAAIFIFWDRLFGTFVEEKAPPVYGVLKPLGSFNPVRAWFSPLVDLARAPSPRAWLKPPGWNLDDDTPPDLKALFETEKRHRFHPRLRHGAFAAASFITILMSASAFLFVYPTLSDAVALGIAVVLVATLAAWGLWIDRMTRARVG